MSGKSKISEETLLGLHSRGIHPRDIGERLGVSQSSVEYQLKLRGLAWKPAKGGKPAVLTDEQEKALVDLYLTGMGATSLSRQFAVNKRTVYNILNRRGVGTRSVESRRKTYDKVPRISERDRHISSSFSSIKSIPELANALGIPEATVRYSLAKQGLLQPDSQTASVRQKQYTPVVIDHRRDRDTALRHDAFDILTPEACYWIGFILADGCVSATIDKTPRIMIRLHQDDAYHLERFLRWLGSSNSVTKGDVETFGSLRRYCSIAVSSRRLSSRLAELGIVESKHGRYVIPSLSESPDFWRGAVDGDGSISATGKGLYLSGSKGVVDCWAAYCDRCLGEPNTVRVDIQSKHGGCWIGRVRRVVDVREMLRILYYPEAVALDRKMARAQQKKDTRGEPLVSS